MKAIIQGITVQLYPSGANCTASFHGQASCRGVTITSISVTAKSANDAVNRSRELIIKARRNGEPASSEYGHVVAYRG